MEVVAWYTDQARYPDVKIEMIMIMVNGNS